MSYINDAISKSITQYPKLELKLPKVSIMESVKTTTDYDTKTGEYTITVQRDNPQRMEKALLKELFTIAKNL